MNGLTRSLLNMKICVVGMGYLGVTHSVAMAKLGHDVLGIDIDASKIQRLASGQVPFFEPGLDRALAEVVKLRRIHFSSDFNDLADAELVFLCLGTPQSTSGDNADLTQLFSAADEITKVLSPTALVVGKSTVPIGTAAQLQKTMSASAGFPVHLAWNPEFLREGTALDDSLSPNRIVVGVPSTDTAEPLLRAYEKQLASGVPVIQTDWASAELIKFAANAFLATKVSFINGIAEIAEVAGADAVHVARALGLDPRIGPLYFRNGLGFGGGCLPKDIRGFMANSAALGVGSSVAFLNHVDQINTRRRKKVVDLALQELGSLSNRKILVLGASFKPGSDDMRDSPSLEVARKLQDLGARVTVHDPVALPKLVLDSPKLVESPHLRESAASAELVILGTEWDEYRNIDPESFGEFVAKRVIIDARNVLDVKAWQRAGWRLIALGRNVHH